jgi:hypothetical protein
MLRKPKANEQVRIAVAVLLVLLLGLFVWRRAVTLASITGRTADIRSHQGGVELPPPRFGDVDHQLSVGSPMSNATALGAFRIDVAGGHYPTIYDFSKQRNGVYEGIKYEMVSETSPRAFLLSGMISTEDAAEIVKVAAEQMARSEVVHRPGESAVNSVRTSFGMFIMTVVEANERLRRRVAVIVGVPIEHIEATQVLRYHPGQYYRVHPDYFYTDATEHLARGGQRFATVLTWLNEIKSGGETKFPYASPKPLTVKQTGVGNSVLFYSTDIDGKEMTSSQHEAVAPGEGSIKWVAVCWVRQREFR